MDVGEVLLGVGLVVASALAFLIARPRDGRVRHFLRNDAMQAYFTVIILGAFTLGLVTIVTGFVPG
jgi:hypothetical protein